MSKITLEPGAFDWNQGRGYQPPAGGGGLPPGWTSAPDEVVYDTPAPTMNEVPAPSPPPEPPVTDTPHIADTIMDAVTQLIGEEFVSVSTGTAVFMNHDLTLSADGLATIKMILGWEVCRQLESEKERILGTVLVEGLPPADRFHGIGRPDMPPLPSAKEAVVAEEQGGPGEVQRVREPKAAAVPKDVRAVPRKKASKAGARAKPRRVVPRPDAGGVQG